MDTVTRVQFLDEVAAISHNANTFRKVCIQQFPVQLLINSRAD